MGPLDFLEDEYVDFSSARTTLRELLELIAGAALFVAVVAGLTDHLLGRTEAIVVAAVLGVVFAVTIASQAYWAATGRDDYRE